MEGSGNITLKNEIVEMLCGLSRKWVRCFNVLNAIKDMGMKSVGLSKLFLLTDACKKKRRLQSNSQPLEDKGSGESFHQLEKFQS